MITKLSKLSGYDYINEWYKIDFIKRNEYYRECLDYVIKKINIEYINDKKNKAQQKIKKPLPVCFCNIHTCNNKPFIFLRKGCEFFKECKENDCSDEIHKAKTEFFKLLSDNRDRISKLEKDREDDEYTEIYIKVKK